MQCGRISFTVIRRVSKLVKPVQKDLDPALLVKNDMCSLYTELRKNLSFRPVIKDVATYYFDGSGKAIRPVICFLMSRATNVHATGFSSVTSSQRDISRVTEMIHASSLIHDDVIDGSDKRRGKETAHYYFSHKEAVMGGSYILFESTKQLAMRRNCLVLNMLAQVPVDLIQGELMQLRQKDDVVTFPSYLQKTFYKTASLIAYSCKAVAVLSGADKEVQEAAFEYGKNCGIAFQLIDDALDYTPSHELGKPAFGDIKSGMITAPLLFACEKFPELKTLINRRFNNPGDVERVLDLVYKSDGLEKTKMLAQQHCQEAVDHISFLKESDEKKALGLITTDIIDRKK